MAHALPPEAQASSCLLWEALILAVQWREAHQNLVLTAQRLQVKKPRLIASSTQTSACCSAHLKRWERYLDSSNVFLPLLQFQSFLAILCQQLRVGVDLVLQVMMQLLHLLIQQVELLLNAVCCHLHHSWS